jgi:hypothetical protein
MRCGAWRSHLLLMGSRFQQGPGKLCLFGCVRWHAAFGQWPWCLGVPKKNAATVIA